MRLSGVPSRARGVLTNLAVQPTVDRPRLRISKDPKTPRRSQGISASRRTDARTLDADDQSQALAGNLLRLMDAERRRLAREFHDDLSQQIAHVEFEMQRLEVQPPRSRREIFERLKAIRAGVTEFSENLRRTAHRLHPAMLEHLDFATVINSFAGEFSERTGVSVTVKSMGVPPPLSPELSSSLYSIVREALNNVSKHAGAAAAAVTIVSKDSTLALQIADTGCGFNINTTPKRVGLGLISIRERVRLLNGKFSIDSAVGAGVSINIIVPTEMQS